MGIDTERNVADIALERPQAAATFEKLGIDYCCGGRKPLAAACEAARIDVNHVTDLLEKTTGTDQAGADAGNWNDRSLSSLINHIVQNHHGYCREETLRLQPLLAKVASKHGGRHPELAQVQELFMSLSDELSMHLMKEERMLFPYIIGLEESATHNAAPRRAPFGAVQNPIRMMVLEHDSAGNLTKEIRQLTQNFTTPEGACNSFKALYQGLEAFEADLHLHIHVENNLLFPRAIALEDGGRSAQPGPLSRTNQS